MKSKKMNSIMLAAAVTLCALPVFAQTAPTKTQAKTDSKISYHNGPIMTVGLPQDPSADVSSNSTGFCQPSALPHHGVGEAFGLQFRYGFLGNPNRCPTVAAPQFFSGGSQLPTPNQSLPADALASMMAQML